MYCPQPEIDPEALEALRAIASLHFEVTPVGRARHIGGFTLACAVWHLSEPDAKARHTLRAVGRKHRTYLPYPAKFLFQIENNGSPHALALQIASGAVLVTDQAKQFKLSTDLLEAILAQVADSSTAVSFELRVASNSVLLDLQAGSAEDRWRHVSYDQAVVPESKFIVDDERMVVSRLSRRRGGQLHGKEQILVGNICRCTITTVARYVLFGPSIGCANYVIMFASSMWNQTNLYARAQSRSRPSWHYMMQIGHEEKGK